MQHDEIRMAAAHGTQLRQRHRAVPPHRDGDRARIQDGADAGFDQRIGSVGVTRVAGHVAHVDGAQELGRIVDAMAAEDVDGTQQAGLLAYRVGPLPRPDAEWMRAAIERNTDHASARQARPGLADRWQTHEPGNGVETDFR
ncbi:hypothetical protein D3C73_1196840 [compost metagenome]